MYSSRDGHACNERGDAVNMNVLVARLRSLGIRVNAVNAPDDVSDGEIDLDHGFHIQVGSDYMCLNQSTPRGTIKFGRTVYQELGILHQIYTKPKLRTRALTEYLKTQAKAGTN